ncbi:site-specific DNA-methyltransferase [Aquabacterium sp.]|uniref:site-specific DNA-methyltransferase n=1 Tax=Aquabacterium sp. TaxID=1872578 RepID=UPI00260EF32B|nr:site-specific DNA-methyltransferase [Aquabacterium sp.]MDD2977109.1 site-specific DNA-methyltransferase [Aquabacterium sp.]
MLQDLEQMSAPELRRLLAEHLTRQKLGLYWERNAIEHDQALNANVVLPRLVPEWSHTPEGCTEHRNLIIEGDNFDSLRLLRSTHAGKVRVIYIDPPYNTGNKDWVYNDSYVGANDRWRHSQWLEFLYQRMTLARELLTADGVILVSINDENRARLEMLMDEVFPGRRLGTIVWRTRQGSNADQQCFLSVDHEHLLVYGNANFAFNGFGKSYEMYSNPDNDPRGDWRPDNLTLGFSFKERPNLYYPLVDEKTGIHYPPNPDRIWVYASEARLKPGQTLQAKSMEEFVRLGQILFPKDQRVETWETLDDLLNAIDTGDVPKSGKTPILRRDLPDLEQWVGKPVGFGRPQFKRYKADLRNQTQPLSSWIVPTFEEGTYEAEMSLTSATNQEGARQVAQIFGDRAFNYAKPASLIKGLLSQATRPDDIVLDFFAGSGTTGQVVMELNAEDGGHRRFILCSSTEATDKEPAKNLCRDVCAERMRRVMLGYADKPGHTLLQGGEFAYLQLDKLDQADVALDATPDHATTLLALRHAAAAPVAHKPGVIRCVAKGPDWMLVLCPSVNTQVLDNLCALPEQHGVARLVVYAPRPKALAALLAERGVEAQVHALRHALIQGQGGRK